MDCQRHNSEATRKNLEEKAKERERELNSDITRMQADMGALGKFVTGQELLNFSQ